jgi:multicomponent Na+:H+ antiporter subunit D
VVVALVVSLLTLYSMTKIWSEAFWQEETKAISHAAPPLLMVLPVLLLAAVTVLIGLGCGFAFDLADRAAGQLMNPKLYIDAVLGGGP